MQKKKIKTINSKWLAYSILNELFNKEIENDDKKILKISDARVFSTIIFRIIGASSKRIIVPSSDFSPVSKRTFFDSIIRLKGLDILCYENTDIKSTNNKGTRIQGYNRYWINEKFLEDENFTYKINWSKLK